MKCNITHRVSAITFHYFLDIWNICFACYSHRSARFWRKFLFPCTYCLTRCLIRSITFHQISKIQHNRKINNFAGFYISSNFMSIIFSTRFPISFTTLFNDRLALLKWLKILKLCGSKARVYTHWKVLNRALQGNIINEIVQSVIALYYNTYYISENTRMIKVCAWMNQHQSEEKCLSCYTRA